MSSGNQTVELQNLSATSVFWKLGTTPGLLLQQNCCLVQTMIWKLSNTDSEKQQHAISSSAAFSASLFFISHHLIPIILLLWYTQALAEPQPPPSSKTPGAEKCSAKPSADICCQAAFLPLLWDGQIHHSHTFLRPTQNSHWKAGPAEKAAPLGYYSKDAEHYLSSGVTDRFSRSSSSAVKEKILSSHLRNKASVTQHCFKSTFCVTTVAVSNIFIFTTPFLDVGNSLSPSCKTGIRSLISSADLTSAANSCASPAASVQEQENP